MCVTLTIAHLAAVVILIIYTASFSTGAHYSIPLYTRFPLHCPQHMCLTLTEYMHLLRTFTPNPNSNYMCTHHYSAPTAHSFHCRCHPY